MTPISVCIPVYNVERYIENCINSVLEQTFQDFEIIVVDDATPDNSMNIVRSIAQKDSRIKIYSNPHNMGLMWTRMEGYKRAIGEYIVFLDSDDTLPCNALEKLYTAIKSSKSDIVCGQTAYIAPFSTSLNKFSSKLNYGNDAKSALKSVIRREITHNLWGKIYKTELLQSYKYFTYENVTNAEDAMLFYQILPNITKINTIDDVVYNYYYYETSSSNVQYSEKALRGIFLAEKHRYDIVNIRFPELLPDLKKDMIKDFTSLALSIKNKDDINRYLSEYNIPFKVNFINIIRFAGWNRLVKCLFQYYCPNISLKIRNYRLNKQSK